MATPIARSIPGVSFQLSCSRAAPPSARFSAIWRYLEDTYPATPLLGTTPRDKALVTMWERRAELEGFSAVMEGVRNAAQRLADRAIAGPHDYAQIPDLVERSKRRIANFYSDMEARLAEVPFVAGGNFSAADITTLVAVDLQPAHSTCGSLPKAMHSGAGTTPSRQDLVQPQEAGETQVQCAR